MWKTFVQGGEALEAGQQGGGTIGEGTSPVWPQVSNFIIWEWKKIWFPRWKIFELDGCEGAGKACLVFPPKSEGAQVRKSKGAQERNKRGSGRINKIKGEIMMKFVVLLFWNVQKVDETGNLHMELIPPEPQVIFGSCKKKGSSQLLNGRFGSLIDPLSGTTLLLTFPGEKKKTKC